MPDKSNCSIHEECNDERGTTFRVYINSRNRQGDILFPTLLELVREKMPKATRNDISLVVAGHGDPYTYIRVQQRR